MGKKRKRPVKGDRAQDKSSQTDSAPAPTCFKSQSSLSPDHPAGHSHPVISLYYPQTVPLRQYLLRQIPPSSKSRRRRIASVRDDCSAEASDDRSKDQCQGLANLLDSTLVGILKESPPTCNQERRRELIAFTQSQSKSKIIGTDSGPLCAQTEIVDFVVSSHFNRVSFSRHMPCHLLTRGFVRAREENTPACDIPGLVAQFPNDNVQKLKQAPWTEVLGLLGTNGEEIMLGLLLDCGVFTAVDEQRGIYFQLSGLPLSMLEPMNKVLASDPAPTNTTPFIKSGFALASGVRGNAETGHQKSAQAPAPIIFFRRRILYAPPTFDSRGKVHPGLKAHVLSHFPSNSLSDTIHVLKYVFPRQFGLHNIFTSMLSGQHMQTFKDYSSREEEISQSNRRKRPRTGADVGERSAWIEIPKRLHSAVELVRQLQNRHKHCSYAYLLNYYCSAEVWSHFLGED
ncbi:hypothetical protein BO71DRAFT_319834 [Aspergillus ellipticus CBS 707.79]|uniref:Telomerase reverse transcriptase n=1 Tax=Aspergillus ellipticus CBS 707.79 TaxID=1448320 RepID=A0A319DHY0_9EURO|nr:hypothetical protein BO71DRAFT_319834 [Aspergillus ellipticus CBS 707.79]